MGPLFHGVGVQISQRAVFLGGRFHGGSTFHGEGGAYLGMGANFRGGGGTDFGGTFPGVGAYFLIPHDT